MRIAIIGSPGSGKSTLAQALHKKTHIPLYHLDQHFWKPGWLRPDRSEFEKIHRALCDKAEWIIEGMAIRHIDYRIDRADAIIFLNVPLWKCLYRVFKRALSCYGVVRDSSAKGCPDRLPTLRFLAYMFEFQFKHKPKIRRLLHQYASQKAIHHVKTEAQLRDTLQQF